MAEILAIARITALEAVRGRIAWLLAGVVVAGCALALLAGEIALTEARGFRAGLLAAWLRTCAVLTVGVIVIASMVREFDDKGVELVLSTPLPRGAYCAGKLAGFAGVSVVWSLACVPALAWCAPAGQVAIWSVSLCLELLIVTAASLLCVLTFGQVTWALSAVMGFYVLARAMTALQLMAHDAQAASADVSTRFVREFVDGIAFVLPDLDRFTESSWLIHADGTVADLGFAAAQATVYLALLGAAAAFDFYRKAL